MRKFFTKLMSLDNKRGIVTSLLVVMLLSFVTAADAQKRVVTGKVVDSTGEPVIGATVIETGTMNGVATDVDGKFSISLRENGNELTVESLGYVSQKVNISGKSNVNVELAEDAFGIEAVVAIGYGQDADGFDNSCIGC